MEVKYTPMMMQYLKIKEKHPDTLILFRLGDFYELFFDDAKIASRELQLALTGKSAGTEEKVPMCGVPHHAISSYIDKLIAKGYKVGIVEQLEEATAGKKIVERDVVQIITPGAFLDFKDKDNNYLGQVSETENYYVFSYCDVSTGEIFVENLEKDIDEVIDEITNLNIKEIIVSTSFSSKSIERIKQRRNVLISYENNDIESLEHQYILSNVKDLNQRKGVVRLLSYIKETQKRDLDYMKVATVLKNSLSMQIDAFSRVNLELIRTIRSEESYGTLFWLLDETSTNMGSRLLKKWIMKPTCDLNEILSRQSIIESLQENFFIRDDIKSCLKNIYDLERLIAKINFGSASGRDLIQLKKSLQIVPELLDNIHKLGNKKLINYHGTDEDFISLSTLLENAISEDAPITVKEGGIFKKGFNSELDELIDLSSSSKAWIASLEAREKERTGIKTLKVGYNRVFGYYIEVSKGAVSQIPEEWGYERKQTTINSERFISQELKDYETRVLTAEETRCALEYALFNKIREEVNKYTLKIQNLADLVSYVDVMVSLTEISINYHYVKPTFNDDRKIEIINGRHPVIEKVMSNKRYVPNNIIMDNNIDILVLTGPNMGGKSTYMRQLALIVILAQIGSFVPAQKADLMIFDSIFTRIGASDDLVSGQSTFMVEMVETNYALRHASENSLLLFDEIGRGTATFDGMALAQSIIEYIAAKIHAKTLFSTHYHEITKIEDEIPTLKNIHVGVSESQEQITFLYKVEDGAMGKSYGINVASLAKLPEELLSRAKVILNELEQTKITIQSDVIKQDPIKLPSWIKDLEKIDPLSMSPLEALNYLYELKRKMKE